MKIQPKTTAFMLSIFFLSACSITSFKSSSSSSGTNIVDNVNALHPEIVPLAQLTNKYSHVNPIEIDLWTGFGAVMSVATQNAVDAFCKAYPYIKVDYETKGSYDGLNNSIIRSISTNSYPNVTIGFPNHFADYLVAGIQYVLDGFVKSDDYGVDLNDYYQDYLQENQSMIYMDDSKNQPYTVGLPFSKSTEVMVYNKDFFEAFDLTVPATWDEVNTVGAQIVQLLDKGKHWDAVSEVKYIKDGQAKTYTLDLSNVEKKDFYPMSYDSQANLFITMAKQFGGQYTEMGDSIKQGSIKFNNPQVLESLNFIKKMYMDHILGIPEVWYETGYCAVPFRAMKSVMLVSSSAGVINNIPEGNVFSVGIAPVPYKTADKKYVISQGTNLAILKESNPEKVLASWLLVRYLSGGVYQDENTVDKRAFNANVSFALMTGCLPVTKSGEQSELYQTYINSIPGTSADRAIITAQKVAKIHYTNENWTRFIDPAFVGSAEIRSVVRNIIPFTLIGNSGKIYSPQEAIDYAYKQLLAFI